VCGTRGRGEGNCTCTRSVKVRAHGYLDRMSRKKKFFKPDGHAEKIPGEGEKLRDFEGGGEKGPRHAQKSHQGGKISR